MNNSLSIKPLGLPQDSGKPLIIAGPCSAETEAQTLTTAHALANQGIKIFRAGVWKPRTKPGYFEGHGAKALPWLSRVKTETGMLVATEVAMPQHVELAVKAGIDIFWIGARTTTNPFAVQELAEALRGIDIPILIKNPINPDIDLWIGAIERIAKVGIKRIALIHRGFSCYDSKPYRYMPMWQIPIEMHRRLPQLSIICDPSHMGGDRSFIAPLSQQALDINMDGLMIECHFSPDNAWSDAKQQITPETLKNLLSRLQVRTETQETEDLALFRKDIDDIDKQIIDLVSQRMNICRNIGQYKKDHGMSVVHNSRYSEIIQKCESQGKTTGISSECVRRLFEEIHQESIRQQIEIIQKDN